MQNYALLVVLWRPIDSHLQNFCLQQVQSFKDSAAHPHSKFKGVYLPRPTGRTTNELFISVLAVTGIKNWLRRLLGEVWPLLLHLIEVLLEETVQPRSPGNEVEDNGYWGFWWLFWKISNYIIRQQTLIKILKKFKKDEWYSLLLTLFHSELSL